MLLDTNFIIFMPKVYKSGTQNQHKLFRKKVAMAILLFYTKFVIPLNSKKHFQKMYKNKHITSIIWASVSEPGLQKNMLKYSGNNEMK